MLWLKQIQGHNSTELMKWDLYMGLISSKLKSSPEEENSSWPHNSQITVLSLEWMFIADYSGQVWSPFHQSNRIPITGESSLALVPPHSAQIAPIVQSHQHAKQSCQGFLLQNFLMQNKTCFFRKSFLCLLSCLFIINGRNQCKMFIR